MKAETWLLHAASPRWVLPECTQCWSKFRMYTSAWLLGGVQYSLVSVGSHFFNSFIEDN